MFTVKQLSKMAGVTPRTLRYYDEIGLLPPETIAENGYRYYGEQSVLRLQQILLYRQLDIPLEQIKTILGRKDFDVLGALEQHKQELHQRIGQLERLVGTVEDTILFLKGKKEMSKGQFFAGFSDEEQAAYEKEAAERYDPATVQASNQKWKNYSAAEKERIGVEGEAVYADLLAAIPLGPASAQAQAAVVRWRKHIEYFWTPNDAQLLGLAASYSDDPRFKERFDRMDSRLAQFILDAVRVYAQELQK